MDIDSTVQEANVAYPADVNLMSKLAGLGHKVLGYLKFHVDALVPEHLFIDLKAVKEKARAYSFLPRDVAIEKRRAVFKALLRIVKKQMRPVVGICAGLESRRQSMPWNIRRAFDQINTHAWRYPVAQRLS